MYKIITDSSWDMGEEYAKRLDVDVIPFFITFDEKEYKKEIAEISVEEVYEFMTQNPDKFLKTGQPELKEYMDIFEKYASKGINIICFSLHKDYSGSYNSANIAAQEMMEKYPDVQIEVIDSKTATVMQGLLIKKIALAKKRGMDFETAVKEAKRLREDTKIFFTVENLDYLIHGGRVGKLLGKSANIMRINPIICLENAELKVISLARGRAAAYKKTIDLMISDIKKRTDNPEVFSFVVGYGYDKALGEEFRALFMEKMKEQWPDFNYLPECMHIGATIGVHTGPTPIGLGLMEKVEYGL